MSTICINGRPYICDGGNVIIDLREGIATINGKKTMFHRPDFREYREMKISIEGKIDHLEIDAREIIWLTGDFSTPNNVGGVETRSAKVEIGGNVNGNIKTESGDIFCKGNINGNVCTVSGKVIKVR
ncbi:hypothetical protein HYS79_00045 [Patescibacteria group bacterium]|nr:hypothetical protein [Patescibacteria group bacterium]